jgi:hypothetical protein
MKYDSVAAGISETRASAFSVFPDPATVKITVITPAFPAYSRLSVLDISGRERITSGITGQRTILDISKLPAGVYYIKLTGDREVGEGKFIKL